MWSYCALLYEIVSSLHYAVSNCGMINEVEIIWKEASWFNRGTIPIFASKELMITTISSVKISDVPAETPTRYLPNRSYRVLPLHQPSSYRYGIDSVHFILLHLIEVHLMKQGARVWRAPDVSKTDILKIVDILVSFDVMFYCFWLAVLLLDVNFWGLSEICFTTWIWLVECGQINAEFYMRSCSRRNMGPSSRI
jgi:hypothetical protein